MIISPVAVQKPGELAWLLDYVRACDPLVIVEIGVDQGGSFHAFEEAAPLADMIGIDVGYGRWSSGPPLADPRVIIGDSHSAETRQELARRLAGRPVDFLFIDGDHSFDGVAEDYWMYLPLVRDGGLVALHDIAKHPPQMGVQVAEFWQRVKHRHPDAEVRIDEPIDWGGIAVFTVEVT
jgi:cephalosporin hydroxylase